MLQCFAFVRFWLAFLVPSLCLPFSCLLSCAPSVDVPLSLLCRVTSCSGLLVPLCAFPRLAAVPSSLPPVMPWRGSASFLLMSPLGYLVAPLGALFGHLELFPSCLVFWVTWFPVFRASHGNKGFGPVWGFALSTMLRLSFGCLVSLF